MPKILLCVKLTDVSVQVLYLSSDSETLSPAPTGAVHLDPTENVRPPSPLVSLGKFLATHLVLAMLDRGRPNCAVKCLVQDLVFV